MSILTLIGCGKIKFPTLIPNDLTIRHLIQVWDTFEYLLQSLFVYLKQCSLMQCFHLRYVGISDPRGRHGRERRAAHDAVQVAAGAERGGRVGLHRALGGAQRARAGAPGRGSRQRHGSVAALLHGRQFTRL